MSGKQLPQYHVLECQCMDFVDQEATGKRERFWCLTSPASIVCSFWAGVAEVQQSTTSNRACHDSNFHNEGREKPFSGNLLPAVCRRAF